MEEKTVIEESESVLNNLVEQRLKEAQANKEFKDEGRVSGTAKQRRATKDITAANLHIIEEDEIAAQRTIVKAKIWPGVDIEAEKLSGTTSGATYLKVELQKALSAAPYNSKEARAIYIKVLEFFITILGQAKNVDEVIATSKKVFSESTIIELAPEINEADISKRGSGIKRFYSYQRLDEKIELIFSKKFINLAKFKTWDNESVSEKIKNARLFEAQTENSAKIIYDKYKSNSQKAVERLKNEIEAIEITKENLELIRLMNRYNLNISTKATPETIATQKDFLLSSLKRQKARAESETENPNIPEYLKEHPESWDWAYKTKEKTEVKDKAPRINSYPYLSHIVRKGGIDVDNIGTSTKAIKEYWGLKAVQYGNALSDSESKKLAKYANGSFMDLEEITGIDIAELNKIHGLSLDFATRGVAGSAATYWADYKVINLNKRNGDGSLAHEFGHYIDNLLAKKTSKQKEEKINGRLGRFASDTGAAEPEIEAIMLQLMRYIIKGDGTEVIKQTIRAEKGKWAIYKGQYKTWQECYDYYAKRYPKDFTIINGGKAKIAHILAIFDVEKIEFDVPVGSSIVFANSFALGGGKENSYWVKPAELFARAWEVYVLRKLYDANLQNNFLQADHTEDYIVSPYAKGKEAEIVISYIDKLIEAIKKVYGISSRKNFTGPRVDYNEINTTISNKLADTTIESKEEKAIDKVEKEQPKPIPTAVLEPSEKKPEPAPTPEPIEKKPEPVEEKPAEEKPKKQRELSYNQQKTLMIGRVKALGGKMTEAQVIAEGLKLMALRPNAAANDKTRTSKRRLSPTPENLIRWANNPGDFDLIGVDTIDRSANPTADYKRDINRQKLFNLFGIKIN